MTSDNRASVLNPLIETIFNNSDPSKSPAKDVITKLTATPHAYVLLVPETSFLWLNKDLQSGLNYKDLCQNPEFLINHLVQIGVKNKVPLARNLRPSKSPQSYKTAAGREITVKQGVIFATAGFGVKNSCRILRKEILCLSSQVPVLVLYTDRSLWGKPCPRGIAGLSILPEVTLASSRNEISNQPSFEQLARQFSIISFTIGDRLRRLFDDFKLDQVSDRNQVVEQFQKAAKKSKKMFNSLDASVIQTVLDAYPHIKIDECLQNYVELNVHDKLWRSLKKLENSALDCHLPEICHLSMNQVGLPASLKPHEEVILLNRIKKCIGILHPLSFANSARFRCEILIQTFQCLTTGTEDLTIDADTLVGLLVLLVSQASVLNLHTHVFYIKSFLYGFDENESIGFKGYVISTFEGVLNHLEDQENLVTLKECSAANDKFWSLINSLDPKTERENPRHIAHVCEEISTMITCHSSHAGGSFIRARDLDGRSCLMLAIRQDCCRLLEELLNDESLFSFEDILEDRDGNNLTLLHAALESENASIIECIADIVLQGTDDELFDFFRVSDTLQNRNVGHYLFCMHELIPEVGVYIDWEKQDFNGQTPFFTLVRCYDHPKYSEMIDYAIAELNRWLKRKDKEFDFRDHTDKKGNTILHIVKDGHTLRKVIDAFHGAGGVMDFNAFNSSNVSPVMQYVKFSKLDCVVEILERKELDLEASDPALHVNVFDLLRKQQPPSKVALEIESALIDTLIERMHGPGIAFPVVVVKASCDVNSSVMLLFKTREGPLVNRKYDEFVKLLKLLKLENPYLPFNADLMLPFSSFAFNMENLDNAKKLKLNKLAGHLNKLLTFICRNNFVSKHDCFMQFFTTQDPLQEYEFIKQVERKRSKAGEDLSCEEISEMKMFTKYSLNELKRLESVYVRLGENLLVRDHRFADEMYLESHFLSFSSGSVKLKSAQRILSDVPTEGMTKLTKCLRFISPHLTADVCLQKNINFLGCALKELTCRIQSFADEKVDRWWEAYGEMLKLTQELERLNEIEERIYRRKIDGSDKHSVTSLFHAEPLHELNDDNTIVPRSQEEIIRRVEEQMKNRIRTSVGGSFLAGIVQSKRQKYFEKLKTILDNKQKSFRSLSAEVRESHELIALEVNNFYFTQRSILKFIFQRHITRTCAQLQFTTRVLQQDRRKLL